MTVIRVRDEGPGLMDLALAVMLATAAFLAGIVTCLSIIGFGRIPLAAAVVGGIAFAVSLIALRAVPTIWSAEALPVTDVLDRSSRLLRIANSGLAVAVCAAVIFAIAGAMRVWNERLRLLRTGSVHGIGGSGAASASSQRLTRTQFIIGVGSLVAFCGMLVWEFHDFVVTNRGVQYYRENPIMLLYPVGAAAMIGVSLACLSRGLRRLPDATPRRDEH